MTSLVNTVPAIRISVDIYAALQNTKAPGDIFVLFKLLRYHLHQREIITS